MAAMNAADEVLITRFLNREIAFTQIAAGLRITLDQWDQSLRPSERQIDLASLADVDAWARVQAQAITF